MRTDWRAVARLVLLTGLTTTAAVGAQEPDAEDTRWPDPTELALGRAQDDSGAEDIGWSNATELSVVRTQGNAETQTFGFKNTLRRNWSGARARLRFDGIRARASGDRFLVVAPGLRFRPGERPDGFETASARADAPRCRAVLRRGPLRAEHQRAVLLGTSERVGTATMTRGSGTATW